MHVDAFVSLCVCNSWDVFRHVFFYICVFLFNDVCKRVGRRIQTLSIDLFDSLLMSLTRCRIAQSLTLIA